MPEPSRSPDRENILARAKAHMAGHETRSIDIPEWDCTIYWRPVTLNEREEVRRRSINQGMAEGQVHLIVLKALDRDGHKLFDADDKRVLGNLADSGVVSRVANAISNDGPLEQQIADAEKN
jgi:hypothetical protein